MISKIIATANTTLVQLVNVEGNSQHWHCLLILYQIYVMFTLLNIFRPVLLNDDHPLLLYLHLHMKSVHITVELRLSFLTKKISQFLFLGVEDVLVK